MMVSSGYKGVYKIFGFLILHESVQKKRLYRVVHRSTINENPSVTDTVEKYHPMTRTRKQ